MNRLTGLTNLRTKLAQQQSTLKNSWDSFDARTTSKRLIRDGFNYTSSTRPYRYAKWGLIMTVVGRLGYVYGTRFEKDITVSKSFHRLKERKGNPINQYLISDEHHLLYEVTSSFWYLQWFPTELWSSFNDHKRYHVQGYGIRIRRLGIHPKIVHGREV